MSEILFPLLEIVQKNTDFIGPVVFGLIGIAGAGFTSLEMISLKKDIDKDMKFRDKMLGKDSETAKTEINKILPFEKLRK